MRAPRAAVLVAFLLALGATVAAAGCGSRAARYAQEARSSYISARAVLAGLQEFPSRMEKLLREGDWQELGKKGRAAISDARDLVSASFAAFRTVGEKCEALQAERSRKYEPYAEKVLELVELNELIISAYTEYLGLCSSALDGLPYLEDPRALMPILQAMDAVAARIQEQFSQLEALEEEAESLYRELTA
ncbi:MAG: hypothetical protein H5T74_00785 [Actinobacteria bacterium]|nr:hypothetical protein [Actinomycetota bacterium]